ncbi:MAG: hypothetical protein ACJAS5_001368, partial [Lentimonas sp.]
CITFEKKRLINRIQMVLFTLLPVLTFGAVNSDRECCPNKPGDLDGG